MLPAFLSELFGSHISAATHGVAIAVWALATIVGVPIFTSITSRFSVLLPDGSRVPTLDAYIINVSWLAALPALALASLSLLSADPVHVRMGSLVHQL